MDEGGATADPGRLIWLGVLLFLLGLITGFVIPELQNPRMGLSSHLEATSNGMFLMILGLVWPRLPLSPRASKIGLSLAVFGAYANWATTLLAAYWGAGGRMMPIVGGSAHADSWQETVIAVGLISLSSSMLALCLFLLWNMRSRANPPAGK